jgi:hypothetical protein
MATGTAFAMATPYNTNGGRDSKERAETATFSSPGPCVPQSRTNSLGSTAELDTQLEAAVRLGFLTASDVANVLQVNARVGQMLYRLSESLGRELWVAGSSLALLAGATCAALLRVLG